MYFPPETVTEIPFSIHLCFEDVGVGVGVDTSIQTLNSTIFPFASSPHNPSTNLYSIVDVSYSVPLQSVYLKFRIIF